MQLQDERVLREHCVDPRSNIVFFFSLWLIRSVLTEFFIMISRIEKISDGMTDPRRESGRGCGYSRGQLAKPRVG